MALLSSSTEVSAAEYRLPIAENGNLTVQNSSVIVGPIKNPGNFHITEVPLSRFILIHSWSCDNVVACDLYHIRLANPMMLIVRIFVLDVPISKKTFDV